MKRSKSWVSVLVLVAVLVAVTVSGPVAGAPRTSAGDRLVVRVYFDGADRFAEVAGRLDIWEYWPDSGYAVVAVTPAQFDWLEGLGFRLEVDAGKTALLGIQAPLDPRFHYFDDYYPNSNGLYVVDFLQDTNAAYPDLTELYDVGNAWLGEVGGEYNRDIWALRITNEDPAYGVIDDKPAFFLFATIHAREVAVPELAIRYIKYLTGGYNGEGGYGLDADATWLVDHNVLYVLVMQNPDGHWVDEQDTGAYRRKNMDNDDGCNYPDSWGVDLNRNHSFFWGCCGGSSGEPCDSTYRGPERASEPETQAFQDFFGQVMLDQNGPNGDDEYPDAAPPDTTGIFLSLHSYSDLVLWPWDLPEPPPNQAGLAVIGRKLASLNGYEPGSVGYPVDGSTDDWAYGKFGVPSYTFEVGSGGGSCGGFFPAYGCIDGIDGMTRNFWAENKPAFLYMHKIARTPYMTAGGPDAEALEIVPGVVPPGTPVQLSATIADHRYPGDPLQPIAAAEYFVGAPGADGTGIPMAPADGSWGGLTEAVVATVDTTGLPLGQHYLLVHGQNDDGDWGPFTAEFLYVMDPGASPVIQGYVRDAADNAPLAATITADTFQTTSDPETGFYSLTVIEGIYDVTAVAGGHAEWTVEGVEALNYQVVDLDFYLYPFCDIFVDDVESGNLGWTADTPWAITDEDAHSPTHSWTDSPGGDYQPNIDVSLTSPVFDLTGHSGIELSFWHAYDLQDGFAHGYVEYSTDGYTWASVADYNGEHLPPLPWYEENIPIPALDDVPAAQIRFHLATFYVPADGWYLDDVVLFGGGPACVTPLAPTAEFSSNSPVQFGEPVVFFNETLGTPPLDYEWDFGDGVGSSTETNPEYVYAAPGTYNVTLQATNAVGTDSVTHPVTVLGAGDTLHVGGMRLRYADLGLGRYIVYATVRILDQDNQRINEALVDVQWTLPDSSHVDQQAPTNSRGLARFRIKTLVEGTYEVCVTGVAKAGYVYDPDQNVITCDTIQVP